VVQHYWDCCGRLSGIASLLAWQLRNRRYCPQLVMDNLHLHITTLYSASAVCTAPTCCCRACGRYLLTAGRPAGVATCVRFIVACETMEHHRLRRQECMLWRHRDCCYRPLIGSHTRVALQWQHLQWPWLSIMPMSRSCYINGCSYRQSFCCVCFELIDMRWSC